MASDPEQGLGDAVEQVRRATERLRREADLLVGLLAQLNDQGDGPPEVLVAQQEQLLAVERALGDVRHWSERENRLREAGA